MPPHPAGDSSLAHRGVRAVRVTTRLGLYRSCGPPWPRRRWPDSPIPNSPPSRERQAPAGAGLGACGARTAAGGTAQGRAGGRPGNQPAGRQRHRSVRSTAPRQPPPQHGEGAACRPTPPGGPTLLARQVQDSEPAGLGLQRAQLRDCLSGVSWHPFTDSAASSWSLGERVQPPTLRAGRPPKGGHVSPTFSTRSGHYPPTVY